MAKHVVIFACISLLTGIGCSAATITVDPNGSADYTTIQAAINDANNFDMVIVADGTYTGVGNRDIDFLGKAITVRSANGPENCIIDCQDSGRGFYFHNNESPDSVLDGLTITNGDVDDYISLGGGIRIDSSSPTIKNCVISDNSADSYLGVAAGGGISLTESLSLIDNCIISNNSVWAFFEEDGQTAGGGIFLGMGDAATIRNCVIAGNRSLEGTGGGIEGSIASVITNCIIIGNLSTGWGKHHGPSCCRYGGV